MTIPQYKTIPLTKGRVSLVDPEDFERFGHLKWTTGSFSGREHYAYRNERRDDGKLHTVLLHRLILGARRGQFVDHINRDTFDNRRCNLRLSTHQQNQCNRQQPVGRSGFIGVSKNGSAWRGGVMKEYRRYYTKSYDCPILAAAARDVLAQQLHGSFAVLNFQFIPAGGAQ